MACGAGRNILFRNVFAKSLLFRGQAKLSFAGPTIWSSDFCTSENEIPDLTKKEKISKAMKAYLERARLHDEFLKQEAAEFNLGKRHLANIMGEDPETFTQQDIDRAIQYLLPSGLFDPKARPMLKPPEEIFPKKKAAEFDESGRPHHFLFYTTRPNFNELLKDCADQYEKLHAYEDKMLRKHLKPIPEKALNLSGSTWISQEELEKRVLEKLVEVEYKKFLEVMERLVQHPYGYLAESLIMSYRKQVVQQLKTLQFPVPVLRPDGRQSVTRENMRRKRAIAEVTVIVPGTGSIDINGQCIQYFQNIQQREQILFPLIFTELEGKVDVVATVSGGGPSGHAGAIRLGISLALCSFVDKPMMEKMRIAGLLQFDPRHGERKKVGQKGPRAKYTWRKR